MQQLFNMLRTGGAPFTQRSAWWASSSPQDFKKLSIMWQPSWLLTWDSGRGSNSCQSLQNEYFVCVSWCHWVGTFCFKLDVCLGDICTVVRWMEIYKDPMKVNSYWNCCCPISKLIQSYNPPPPVASICCWHATVDWPWLNNNLVHPCSYWEKTRTYYKT